MVGIGYGWIAWSQNSEDEVTPTVKRSLWIASLHEVGRIFGPLFSAICLDNIGRKYTITICSFLFFITWLLMVFARSITLVCAFRILFGVTIGMNDVSSSIYLAENCSPKIRGIVGSFIPVSFYAGMFVECILAMHLSYTTVAVINTLFSFFAFLTFFQLKETPYFLLLKGRQEAAESNLMWLKGCNASKVDVVQELDKIRQNVQTEQLKKASIVKLFASPENYKAMVIVLVTHLLIMATGYRGINFHVSTYFQSSGTFTFNQFTILLGVIQLVAVCISPFIMERYNRRTMILISFLSMGLCHACTFVFFAVMRHKSIHSVYFPWLIFTSITFYSIVFVMIYPSVFIILGELLPMSVKVIGGCLAITVNSLACFATVRSFPIISYHYGIEYNFLLYFGACILGCVHTYGTLPETRGKSLIEIQRELKKRSS